MLCLGKIDQIITTLYVLSVNEQLRIAPQRLVTLFFFSIRPYPKCFHSSNLVLSWK